MITNHLSSLCFRNRAIADYLRSNGYEEAYSTFKKEAELDNVSKFGVCSYIYTRLVKEMQTICLDFYLIFDC